MKKVLLKKLHMVKWRGQNREILFDGDTSIRGANKSGKSTIFSAFLWVLTGVDNESRSNFQLYDNRLPMTHENAIPAEVHIWLDIDGYEYKFSRIAKQSWKREKGKNEYVKGASDTYTFMIDDIALSSKEFKDRIENMFCPIEALKVILNIKHIFLLDWKEQREMFASICDEIKEEDFKGEYTDLFIELKKYSVNEIEARIKTISDPLKKQIKSLPLTIETLESNLPNVEEVEEAKENIESYRAQINDIDKQLQGYGDSISGLIDQRNKSLESVYELERGMADAKRAYENKQRELPDTIRRQIANIDRQNEDIERNNKERARRRDDIAVSITRLKAKVEECARIRERLLEEKNEVAGRQFNAFTCSYCGQELPEEKLEELKRTFNAKKDEEKANVIKRGKDNNAVRDSYLKQIEELETLQAEIKDDEVLVSKDELIAKLEEAEKDVVPYENTNEYISMKAKIEEAKKSIVEIPATDNSGLISMKETLLTSIEEESKKLGLIDERKKQESKIEELKKQQRTFSIELAKQERLADQVKAYKQEYADIVSNKVNVMLDRCQVQMMQQIKSGEWVPSCTITTGNINSTVYNDAEKIFTGIDISSAFSKRYALNMPLFIDNAESISSDNEIKTDRQVVKLIVDEGELRNE